MPNLAANSTLSLLDIVSIFCCSDDWSLSRLLLELVMKRGICSQIFQIKLKYICSRICLSFMNLILSSQIVLIRSS